MAKVILICGKLCCGKTTYAAQLRSQNNAVLLSIDEVMLTIFGQYAGDRHDEYAERTKKYLFAKSLEILETDTPVILDWGFWRKAERDFTRTFYISRNIPCEFHYIDIADETWKARIAKRNAAVLAGEADAYFVDDNLAAKFEGRFEMPSRDEIDVWVKQS